MRARLRKYPDDFVAGANLGSVLESFGGPVSKRQSNISNARSWCRPKSAPAHNMLGTAYQAMGQPALAAATCRTALRLDPASLDADYDLGNALLARTEPADAVACFQRVLHANPNDAAALSDLGS